jgi:hypothetical protein
MNEGGPVSFIALLCGPPSCRSLSPPSLPLIVSDRQSAADRTCLRPVDIAEYAGARFRELAFHANPARSVPRPCHEFLLPQHDRNGCGVYF